jgi:hypothetical protein
LPRLPAGQAPLASCLRENIEGPHFPRPYRVSSPWLLVLFCGGLGTRIRDYSENIPKPMIAIGGKPILWHLMSYYSQYGHKDFILCLGYKANVIKNSS